MLRSLKNQAAFFRQFRERFETTGSIAPSSRFLAKSMVRFLAKRGTESIRVLEIGPGTGPVTEKIIPLLQPGDKFDLVELNESFVTILKERFATDSFGSRKNRYLKSISFRFRIFTRIKITTS